MKILRYTVALLAVIGFITVFLLLIAAVMNAQTVPASTFVIKARIPYDFWIDARRLPAGDYTLSRDGDGVVLFHNNRHAEATKQAFLLPTGDQVAAGDHKLVFVVHNGQHYLREIWDTEGRQVITSQSYLPLADGDTETQVRLKEHKRCSPIAKRVAGQ